jgi:hypothetical protein
MNVWAVLGYICEAINKGMINMELFDDIIQYPIVGFWEKHRSLMYEFRTHYNLPLLSRDIEQVYDRIIKKGRGNSTL